MRSGLAAALFVMACAALLPRPGQAAEVNPGGEVFIDPVDVSGGFMSSLTPLSPRPQTQIHVVPVEFLLLQMDVPGLRDEHFLVYQLRAGGSIAFARRFELGVDFIALHVTGGRYVESITDVKRDDSDVNLGNLAIHFLGNILARHGAYPQYLSGAFRLTFPTAGDLELNFGPGQDFDGHMDSWIMEPQFIYGITIANMVTLSTRQGLAIFIVPGDDTDNPFRDENQVHWAMNFAVGVAPNRWFSLVADFSAWFCLNEVEYWDPEEWRFHDNTHPIFLYLGLGGKVYPIPALSLEAAFRFGLTDETQYTNGLMQFAFKVSYEWDVAIGGVTVIKESTSTGGGSDGK